MPERKLLQIIDYGDRLQPKQLAMSKALWQAFEERLQATYMEISKIATGRTFVIDSASVLCNESTQEETSKMSIDIAARSPTGILDLCEQLDTLDGASLARVSLALARVRQKRREAGDNTERDHSITGDVQRLRNTPYGFKAEPMTPARLQRANSFRRERGLDVRTLDYYEESNRRLGYDKSGAPLMKNPCAEIALTPLQAIDRAFDKAIAQRGAKVELNEEAQGMYHAGVAKAISKPQGCPKCGHEGNFVVMALVCPTHGAFGGL